MTAGFRPRLFQIKSEEELFEYFSRYACHDPQYKIYMCAGLASDDSHTLFEKLIVAWREDIINETVRSLGGSW